MTQQRQCIRMKQYVKSLLDRCIAFWMFRVPVSVKKISTECLLVGSVPGVDILLMTSREYVMGIFRTGNSDRCRGRTREGRHLA